MFYSHDIPFSVDMHLRLLLRLERGHTVTRAVASAVRPGNRVLDAGTGTGLLSFTALRAGASEVVAVDRHHVDLARALAQANGLADRIRFLEADLTRHELPGVDAEQKFDVLVAFVYNNHVLLDEARSRLIFSLKDRFCTKDSMVVPGQVHYRVTGCERTDWDLHSQLADLEQAGTMLRSFYDLDFQPLVETAKQELALQPSRPYYANAREWQPHGSMASICFPREDTRLLTEPTTFTEIDYSKDSFSGYPSETTLQVKSAGRLSGVIWTQDLIFGDQILWSTETFSPVAESRLVSAGEKVSIETGQDWRATNVVRLVR